ncbi:Hypothetical predicted protein [Lecanosticta acicola]|uniref:S-adenosyl-L-methionine-dependent methyltransferase n=1 Tax=Lecanosticta acicola TaxID=111012 RepID=A0AAI8Z153_9PEZI|nr:Hypothetical predicted protein [Lecanosticta acicola]
MQRIAGLRHVATRPPPRAIVRTIRTRQAPPPPPQRFVQARSQAPTQEQRQQQKRAVEQEINELVQRNERQQQQKQEGRQRRNLIFVATFGVGLGIYVLQLVVAALKANPDPAIRDISNQKDVAARYDDTADTFDSDVGLSEWVMGTNRLRKELAKQCKGHVLEVSCGTGRNLGYYDVGKVGKIESLTFVDLSAQMIDVCKKKWEALRSTYGKGMFSAKQNMKEGLVTRFLPASALGQMPLAPNGKKYDTIIQTMGLCSTPLPVELLTNMVKYLDTSNPDARILLLEHGRSYQQWLNDILDDSAQKHADIHGCWYNRDIGELVQDAANRTGLEVIWERRKHLGTTWVFVLKPKENLIQASQGQGAAAEEPEKQKQPPKPSKWLSWS